MTAHSKTAASANLRTTDQTLRQNVVNELQGVGSWHWTRLCIIIIQHSLHPLQGIFMMKKQSTAQWNSLYVHCCKMMLWINLITIKFYPYIRYKALCASTLEESATMFSLINRNELKSLINCSLNHIHMLLLKFRFPDEDVIHPQRGTYNQ